MRINKVGFTYKIKTLSGNIEKILIFVNGKFKIILTNLTNLTKIEY